MRSFNNCVNAINAVFISVERGRLLAMASRTKTSRGAEQWVGECWWEGPSHPVLKIEFSALAVQTFCLIMWISYRVG